MYALNFFKNVVYWWWTSMTRAQPSPRKENTVVKGAALYLCSYFLVSYLNSFGFFRSSITHWLCFSETSLLAIFA